MSYSDGGDLSADEIRETVERAQALMLEIGKHAQSRMYEVAAQNLGNQAAMDIFGLIFFATMEQAGRHSSAMLLSDMKGRYEEETYNSIAAMHKRHARSDPTTADLIAVIDPEGRIREEHV